ncbi:MAG: SH3 domain-containing protein [Methyloceanibacter sp.]
MMLFLWLLGAAIYAGFGLVSPPHVEKHETADEPLRMEVDGAPKAPEAVERSESPLPRDRIPTRTQAQTDKGQEHASINRPNMVEGTAPTDATDVDPAPVSPHATGLQPQTDAPKLPESETAFGQVSQEAPVHSGPSVDSAIVGYASAGAPVHMVERRAGYAKVIDPSSGKEGWIYEIYVLPSEQIDVAEPQQGPGQAASAEPDARALSEAPPQKRWAEKKGKKKFAGKRKRLRLGFRFRRR